VNLNIINIRRLKWLLPENTMQKKYLIGVDLGTSGTKAALYQIDGKLVAEASQGGPSLLPQARSGGTGK
jgi:molecular chaperone DnaK (HSP70)